MSVLSFLQKGQIVDFEIESDGPPPTFTARVESISEAACTIKVLDKDFSETDVPTGCKGTVWGKKRGLKYSLNVEVQNFEKPSIVKLKNVPSRSHLRIDAFIVMTYKKVSRDEFERQHLNYIQHKTTDSDRAYLTSYNEMENQQVIPLEIIHEIRSIHTKLDYILKIIAKTDRENIFNQDPQNVNISGSGIKFRSSDTFQQGDFLEMKLVLPISSGIIIELLGEVVRIKPLADKDTAGDGAHHSEIAIQFRAINEDDREFIIRYVFKRQRELLRAETGD